METYEILKDITGIGRKGEKVDLTPRQARYHLLANKLRKVEPKKTEAKKTASKKEVANNA